jgi:hypothetical protein
MEFKKYSYFCSQCATMEEMKSTITRYRDNSVGPNWPLWRDSRQHFVCAAVLYLSVLSGQEIKLFTFRVYHSEGVCLATEDTLQQDKYGTSNSHTCNILSAVIVLKNNFQLYYNCSVLVFLNVMTAFGCLFEVCNSGFFLGYSKHK